MREPGVRAVMREVQTQLAVTRRLLKEQERQAAERAALLPTMKEVLRLQLDYLRRRPGERSAAAAREIMPALRLVGSKLGIDMDGLLKEEAEMRALRASQREPRSG